MSFISTKMHCENCNGVFDMAFQLPDRNVAPYPDSNNYVIVKKKATNLLLVAFVVNAVNAFQKHIQEKNLIVWNIPFLNNTGENNGNTNI